ncbi:MAG: CCA tRNA nucleotidyltransferase [Bacteroides sp.]|nr:CCA tRNA nucleotidyltransferase [Bacteroides sp.]
MNLKEKLTHPVFGIIQKVADRNKRQVFVVGGFVRDLLLNRHSADLDCVVMGNGIDLCREICAEIEKTYKTTVDLQEFGQFGTCKFGFDGMEIEFVGARKECYRPGSRKPTVEEGTMEEDRMRRDFSINAMALSLNKKTFGKLSDPFNGLEDLQNQQIRSHRDPDQSFGEDPLRMLRAIRFASQLFFDIEAETFAAIIRQKEHVRELSAERITEELNKIILSPKPSYGFKLLDAAGILEIIFPEFCALKGVEVRNKKAHKDNFEHTLEVLDHVAYADGQGNLWLRWAALLHDIAKPKTKRFEEPRGWTFHGHEFVGGKMVPGIFRRFKLPMDENMRFVKKMVELHLRPIILAEDIVTDSAVRRLLFEAGEDIDSLMTLARADITSKNREKVQRYLNNFTIVERKLKELEEKDRIRNFQPPVSGSDIMEYYNLPPCAEIGIIKTRIKDAILDGAIENDRQQAWNLMLEIGQELGLKCPQKS